MAKRLIFIPEPEKFPFIREALLEFKWSSGFSRKQYQKNVELLHNEASKMGLAPILEISSKSKTELGKLLSAFNLNLEINNLKMTVECAYQGSKCFENGGPYHDLYKASSKQAKLDHRLTSSGNIIGYKLFDIEFPRTPTTIFYNWLYIQGLYQNANISNQLKKYKSYSDIVFNHTKSINCQARAAALYVSLNSNGMLKRVLNDLDYYLHLYGCHKNLNCKTVQLELPF